MAIPANWNEISNMDAERWFALGNRYLPGAAALVLVIVLGWQLASLAWMFVPAAPQGDPITVAPPATAAAPTSGGAVNVQRIASAHLFGEAKPEDAVAPVLNLEPDEELQDTRLALTLKGTIAGTDDRLTAAIIADNRNEEKVYVIGDVIIQGATLHAVYRDQVVLRRNGTLEALRLPKELPVGQAPARRTTTRVVSAPAQNSPTTSIQQQLTQNAAKLADVIRPSPYYKDGQQVGFRLYPGRDRRAFSALGLRPGDLVKSIDGATLTDPQQAMQIFQNLGTAEQVSVTIERNGQDEVLTLTTSQLQLGGDEEN